MRKAVSGAAQCGPFSLALNDLWETAAEDIMSAVEETEPYGFEVVVLMPEGEDGDEMVIISRSRGTA